MRRAHRGDKGHFRADMRLLFIHQNFPGQFRHLAPALVAAGHEVVALRLEKGEALTWQGVRVVRYGLDNVGTEGMPHLVGDFAAKVLRGEAAWRAMLRLKEDGFTPDAVVAHPGWGESLFVKDVWPDAPLGLYCEFYYSRVDLDFDPEMARDETQDAPRQRLKNVNNLLHFDFADAGISPTAWQASTFPEPFRDRISVIHDGIDTDLVAPKAEAFIRINNDLTLRPGDELITFVNRNLEPYRGFHIFMRALPELLKRRPGARVVMVGGDGSSYGAAPPDGTWRQRYTGEVRGQIADADWERVHFVGRIPYNTYLAMMQVSAVHVYLTYPFVLSWSLMEAMSAGCAIVASDTPPVAEMIEDGETGVLFPFFEGGAMVEAVCRLLDDPAERARLGRVARERIVGRYDLKRHALPAQQDWVARLAG